MKFLDFVESHFTPVYLARCKKSTVSVYNQVVNLWCDLVGDFELAEITPRHCVDFVTATLEKVKPETVAKYCRHLNTIFLKASKPGYRNREAFGFISESHLSCQQHTASARLPNVTDEKTLSRRQIQDAPPKHENHRRH